MSAMGRAGEIGKVRSYFWIIKSLLFLVETQRRMALVLVFNKSFESLRSIRCHCVWKICMTC